MAHWFVGPIMKNLPGYLQDQYRWQTGMKEDLERLPENLPKIQAAVSAYTRAQITDRNPELNSRAWQLRDAIDEAYDVLDEFEYLKFEEQLELNMKETEVRSSFNKLFLGLARILCRVCERALKIDPNLRRLEAVVKKLDEVSVDVSTFLHLIENARQEPQKPEPQLCKARETGPLPKTILIGRGKDKDFVMQWLRKPTKEDPTHIASPTLYKNISLLSIVGHGGMGKTTLLQHIFEDPKEEFELKIWVCVSDHFDAKTIIADMLGFLNKERPRSESLATFQKSLKAVVQSKRFLLVLDDIWEEDTSKLEDVLCPLARGSFGSKILITTRMDAVASAIANVIKTKMETLRIKGLEEDACLKLLITHAFYGKQTHKNLLNIASLIVKKLSGSPLAAKVIGGVLNSNLNDSFWMKILESNILKVEQSEPGHNNILSILRLSFTFLSQPLQNCFTFCGVFPQDHEFDKDDLVRMWIALGFIQESFVEIEGETLEEYGGRIFDKLVRKSFFDEFQYYGRIHYKIHDLLHDLARSISSQECFGLVGDDVLSFKVPKNVRHLYVSTENPEVLKKIKDVKNLHSLFLISERYGQCSTEILTEIFGTSRRIRLLFINSPWQIMMSEAIKNLRHLRYFNLTARHSPMPRSLSSLYHLRFIIYKNEFCGILPLNEFYGVSDLYRCSLELPRNKFYSLSNLSNRRSLELPRNEFYSVPGIGKLRSLQELNEFNVKNENGYRIVELEHMNELRKLKIHFLENVKDASEASTAKLFDKRKLKDLFLNWGSTVDEWHSHMEFGSVRRIVKSDLDVNVLENLKPYKKLKRLSIVSYKGVSSAEWMCNADSISNLECIRLDKCSEWETLPPFGQLPRLKSLYLRNMPKVKQLRHKFRGNDKVSVFPSLEVLHIMGLQVLEDWFDGAGATAYECFFPCLTELFLDNCPNLQELPYLPPKLKVMRIYSIGWKALNCKLGTSKSIPLETLGVRSCPNITSLLQADVRNLTIEDCPNLISLGGLQQVESGAGKSLQSLPSSERFSSLEFLHVEEVSQLQQLLHIPASLKKLRFEYLESLQCLPSSLSAISSLKHLNLESIPLLKSLSELPPSLSVLRIISLDKFIASGLHRVSCLRSPMTGVQVELGPTIYKNSKKGLVIMTRPEDFTLDSAVLEPFVFLASVRIRSSSCACSGLFGSSEGRQFLSGGSGSPSGQLVVLHSVSTLGNEVHIVSSIVDAEHQEGQDQINAAQYNVIAGDPILPEVPDEVERTTHHVLDIVSFTGHVFTEPQKGQQLKINSEQPFFQEPQSIIVSDVVSIEAETTLAQAEENLKQIAMTPGGLGTPIINQGMQSNPIVITSQSTSSIAESYAIVPRIATSYLEYPGRPLVPREMQDVIDDCIATHTGVHDFLANKGFGRAIDRASLEDVLLNGWFGNEHVDVFADILRERIARSSELYRPYLFVTSQYWMHRNLDSAAFLKHITKDNIKEAQVILFPIVHNDHWTLLVGELKLKKWKLYDPLPNIVHKDVAHQLVKLFAKDAAKCLGRDKPETWELTLVRGIPTQNNSVDCGMFVCKFMETLVLAQTQDIDWTPYLHWQQDMERFRTEFTYAICMWSKNLTG